LFEAIAQDCEISYRQAQIGRRQLADDKNRSSALLIYCYWRFGRLRVRGQGGAHRFEFSLTDWKTTFFLARYADTGR